MLIGVSPPLPIAQVIGANANRIRNDCGATLVEVAAAANILGTKWNSSTVSRIEKGRFDATPAMLVVLTWALDQVKHSAGGSYTSVTMRDLLGGDDTSLEISPIAKMSSAQLIEFLGGGIASLVIGPAGKIPVDSLWKMFERFGPPGSTVPVVTDQDQRIARSMGIPVADLHDLSLKLWGRTLAAERDARGGESANAQKRGRITRELKAELRAVLDGDNK